MLGELHPHGHHMVNFALNEVFESIQGEASFAGMPSVFVRLQGCPVGCPWCDTKHTWKLDPDRRVRLDVVQAKEADDDRFAVLDVTDVVDVVNGYDAMHVVLTGGEPCTYDLTELTRILLALDYSVQVETSGTEPVRVAPGTFVTVSPKLDMPGMRSVRDDALYRADEVKMVVGKPSDVEKLSARVLPYVRPGTPVWLQPLSASAKATELCVKLATLHGYRVSLQTHKLIGVR